MRVGLVNAFFGLVLWSIGVMSQGVAKVTHLLETTLQSLEKYYKK